MKTIALFAVASFAVLTLTGCGTTATGGHDNKVTGIQCADCKTIAKTEVVDLGKRTETTRKMVHVCSGCRGELETLLREGKWEHKCTKCAGAPCDYCSKH